MAPPPVDGAPPWADLRETHSGVVVLLGDAAYKLKKPVDLGFLDFSTLEKRREACRREVELNRRIAPDVYRGVGDLVGEDGTAVEHLVMMRRMPESRRLSHLVTTETAVDADVDADVRAVARTVAAFHAHRERTPAGPGVVTAAALRELWQSSFAAMPAWTGRLVPAETEAEIERLVARYLDGRAPLLERRRLTGSVLDGHGDLLAEDIFCLDDGPRVLDCLDFDDHLRVLDQVDDAACLAMDLEHLGRPGLARRFLDWYLEFSGDTPPDSLVEHYMGYRAFVRTKVACIRSDQGDADSAREARQLISLSLRHLRRGVVQLVLVGGAPGTGKSTVAAGVADRLGMTLLTSDRVRKELAGLSPAESAAASLGEGIYTEEWSRYVYEELMRRAEVLLGQGESVVVDATWATRWSRQLARRAARAGSADLVEICCQAPAAVVEDRLRLRADGTDGRVSAAGSVSDADATLAGALRETFEPWRSAHALPTTVPVRESVSAAAQHVRRDERTEERDQEPGA